MDNIKTGWIPNIKIVDWFDSKFKDNWLIRLKVMDGFKISVFKINVMFCEID